MLKVEPIYTGDNIYVFFGKLNEEKFFLADSCNFNVLIFNADPWLEGYEKPMQEEWRRKHNVKCLKKQEALSFFIEMLEWVKENEPEGHYTMEDIKTLLTNILEMQKND